MAVRIPGPGRTAGLESLYLDQNPDWIPRPIVSAGVQLAPGAEAVRFLADEGTTPIAASLSDTSADDAEQNNLISAADDQGNQVAVDAGDMGPLLEDQISGNVSGINDQLDQSGGALGSASQSGPPSINPGSPPRDDVTAPGRDV